MSPVSRRVNAPDRRVRWRSVVASMPSVFPRTSPASSIRSNTHVKTETWVWASISRSRARETSSGPGAASITLQVRETSADWANRPSAHPIPRLAGQRSRNSRCVNRRKYRPGRRLRAAHPTPRRSPRTDARRRRRSLPVAPGPGSVARRMDARRSSEGPSWSPLSVDVCRANGLLPIAMALKCTKLDRSGTSQNRRLLPTGWLVPRDALRRLCTLPKSTLDGVSAVLAVTDGAYRCTVQDHLEFLRHPRIATTGASGWRGLQRPVLAVGFRASSCSCRVLAVVRDVQPSGWLGLAFLDGEA